MTKSVATITQFADWLTREQVIDELGGIAPRTVDRLAERGQLEKGYRRVPGRRPAVVFNPEDVKLLKKNTVPAHVVPDSSMIPGTAVAMGRVLLQPQMPTLPPPADWQPAPDKLFLTIKEAAQVSGLSKAFIRRIIAEGGLPFIRDGHAYKVPQSSLKRLEHRLAGVEQEWDL
jgi:excisionase family DNA binding protein